MKKTLIITLFLVFGQSVAQQMEVLYTLDYEANYIIPSNGYHACIGNNETTEDGIFDIYDIDGSFIDSKNFIKGNYTSDPSVNMLKGLVISPENSIATGRIDNDVNGYWSAIRLYDTGANPLIEKVAYNVGCIPFLVDDIYYGVFYVLQNNDMMSTNWSLPYTGDSQELFIAPLNNDLSLGNWILPATTLHPNTNSIENIQAMPNGNLLVSIVGDFSPPLDLSSKAIEIDITTGAIVGLIAEGFSGFYDFHKYDYITGDLYVYHDAIKSIQKIDSDGDITYPNFPPNAGALFNNRLTNLQIVNDEVIGINSLELGQTTHLSKDLIQGFTTPSFQFNTNFLINSGWMNEDGTQILPTIYTGDGMQIGATTLPNISGWNTVVCRMTNIEPLQLRGTLIDTSEDILAVYNHQIHNGTNWVDGYFQSTLVFANGTVPDIGDTPDESWVESAPGMTKFSTYDVHEITRNEETFNAFRVWFKKTGVTGVELVEVALEVQLKSATEVGLGTEDLLNNEIHVSVFPNPVIDVLTVISNSEIQSIEIYDVLGKMVLDLDNDFGQIDISTLPHGIYLCKIINENGLFGTKKIMKK